MYKGVTPWAAIVLQTLHLIEQLVAYTVKRQDIGWPTSSLSEDEDAALLAASIEARVVLFLESLSSHIENNSLNLRPE